MSAKLCPMNVISRAICPDGGFPIECGEDSCAWWHGGMCDVTAIARALETMAYPSIPYFQSSRPFKCGDGIVTCVDCKGDA